MKRQLLTDRFIKACKPAAKGQRVEYRDTEVPGLALRVTDTGHKSFALITRFPGANNRTRRRLGDYGAMTLLRAREKARDWLALIERGIDPNVKESSSVPSTPAEQILLVAKMRGWKVADFSMALALWIGQMRNGK